MSFSLRVQMVHSIDTPHHGGKAPPSEFGTIHKQPNNLLNQPQIMPAATAPIPYRSPVAGRTISSIHANTLANLSSINFFTCRISSVSLCIMQPVLLQMYLTVIYSRQPTETTERLVCGAVDLRKAVWKSCASIAAGSVGEPFHVLVHAACSVIAAVQINRRP